MSELEQHIEDFLKRGLDYLRQKGNNAYAQVQEELLKLYKATEIEESGMAIAEWETKFSNPTKTVVPVMLKYGDLLLKNDKGSLKIPFLLPTSVNAVLFDVGDDAESVPNLFQNIILRLLLSMKMDLVRVSIVDKDYGNSFSRISNIKNKAFYKQLIYQDEDISKLINNLAKETSKASQDYLGRFQNLDVYNAQAGELVRPYHFVFIDDFPNGFTSQAIEELLSLINNGNALRAGIMIFINYSKINPAPYGFDPGRLEEKCACLIKQNGSLDLRNWNVQFPSNVTPKLELSLPKNDVSIMRFINDLVVKKRMLSLNNWIEEMKSDRNLWSGDSTNGISVPIGFIDPTTHFDFRLACENRDFFALITGQPGCGKSWLLKNVIVNAALKYSPDELCFYLADFAPNGGTFNIFEKLPHVRALMMNDNRKFVLRMFKDVLKETDRRSILYQEAQEEYGVEIEKLSTYREVTRKPMPRIVFIIDEFQVLFPKNNSNSEIMDDTAEARCLLERAIREWRKFGVSVILSTQTLTGFDIGEAVLENTTYRFAMKEKERVSKDTIGNDAAKYLTEPGQVIMNNAGGEVSKNVLFQAASIENHKLVVDYLVEKYKEKKGEFRVPFVCKRGNFADIADNYKLVDIINEAKEDNARCCVYVGKHELLREEQTRLLYDRKPNSNTFIFGDDNKTLVFNVMLQLIQIKQQSHPNSKYYIVDCFNHGDDFRGSLEPLSSLSDSFVFRHAEDMDVIAEELNKELMRRKDAQRERMVEERVVLVVLNAQNCDALKPVHDRFTNPSNSAQALSAILAEGSSFGIHCIIHAFSFASLFKSSGIFKEKELEHFTNRIALMGADTEDNMYLSKTMRNLRLDEPRRMIVENGGLDGEVSEQCSVYSRFTVREHSIVGDFVSAFFAKYSNLR